ncbi:MAG: ribbon-helix-helix protein, CopG family [Proteobacteria bacterium]|nr:ribbon-helix-helix protein, CopG family [Pseudomonadota bacterium]
MRTTIDIDDELLRALKAHAAGENKSLKATFEQALREFLTDSPPDLLPGRSGRRLRLFDDRHRASHPSRGSVSSHPRPGPGRHRRLGSD